MQKVVTRILKGALWNSFSKWLEVGSFWKVIKAEQKLQDIVLRRMILGMKNIKLSSGWKGWMKFIVNHQRRERIMRNVLGRSYEAPYSTQVFVSQVTPT